MSVASNENTARSPDEGRDGYVFLSLSLVRRLLRPRQRVAYECGFHLPSGPQPC
jgi:hypothetical protein